MDLKDQLQKLFPEHQYSGEEGSGKEGPSLWIQEEPLICKFEKRKGKPITIIEGYNGAQSDFKSLAGKIKKRFSVGGSFKNEMIIIQGDYRDEIMVYLKEIGFNVKRVGG